jgi:sarcosine oxidase
LSAYDLIVVGLGAAGSATLYQAAKRGARVLGLDRFAPPHAMGSSHGESRITRQAIGEGLEYVPLALRAHEIWREIEAQTGESLMGQVGALLISSPRLGAAHHGKPDFLELTLDAAQAFAIAHERLAPAEARARWPQLRVADHETVYFEPGGGYLDPERCIAAQLELARRHGAEIRLGEAVRAIDSGPGEVEIVTGEGRYGAQTAIVAAGAWTAGLLGGRWAADLTLFRQSMHWFEPDAPAAWDTLPVFIWMHGAGEGDWFYGFPRDARRGGAKLASEQFAAASRDADSLDRETGEAEALAMYARHVPGRLAGLPPAWLRSSACIYTNAPASRFLIGPDPKREGVIVVSACSGHGFKHSPAIGEAVAELALTGVTPGMLAPFAPR